MADVQDIAYANLRRAVSLLVNGTPVAFPTDTVYALAAPVNCVSCVQKVFDIKQRPITQPLPLLLGEVRDVDLVAYDVSDIARQMMCDLWPGALTLVFRKKPFVSDIVTGGQPTVGVRIANHPVAIDIVKWVDVPVIGTSANLHGLISPLTAQEVQRQIGDKVDLIIDGGKTSGGVESTILDMSTDKPHIIRQGAVLRETLEKYCSIY